MRASAKLPAFAAAIPLALMATLGGCELFLGIEDRELKNRSDASVVVGNDDASAQDGSSSQIDSEAPDVIVNPADAGSDAAVDAPSDAFLPTMIEPPAVWFSDQGFSVDPGSGEVQQWNDRSGNNRHLLRGNAAAPSIKVAKFPGTQHDAVQFAPGSTYPVGYLFAQPNWGVDQALTIALAFHPTRTTAGYFDMVLSGAAAPSIAMSRSGAAFQMSGGSGPTFSALLFPDKWTETPLIVMATYAGGTSQLRINGDKVSGSVTNVSLTALVLSANDAAGQPATAAASGYYGEIIIYKRALEAVEAHELELYLIRRFAQ